MKLLKGFIYLFICLLAVSPASAYIPDEGKGVAVYIIQTYNLNAGQEIIYCNNADCYLITSIDTFETCVNAHETNEISCTKLSSPLEFTKRCEEDSTLCSHFVSDNWEDWFYFGFENLGKKPEFAKIAFILAHTMYLDSGKDIDPTNEDLLTSLLEIDFSASAVNRLHAFTLAFYLANRNVSEETISIDLKKTLWASIKSAPRIFSDIFDETLSFIEVFFKQTPTDASAEVATLVRTFILDIFPDAISAEDILPSLSQPLHNEQT